MYKYLIALLLIFMSFECKSEELEQHNLAVIDFNLKYYVLLNHIELAKDIYNEKGSYLDGLLKSLNIPPEFREKVITRLKAYILKKGIDYGFTEMLVQLRH
jgi:hypothetical protein